MKMNRTQIYQLKKNRKGYVSCLDLEKKILIVVEFLTQ